MQIILTQKVDKLGRKGEVKTVKKGYYRNFLLPNGLAFTVTPKRLKWAEGQMEKIVKEKEELAKEATKFKEKFESLTLVFEEKTTGKDTLYSSIGEKELIAALEEQAKAKVDKKQIVLSEPIKKVGVHQVKVHLADGIDAVVKVEVKEKK